MSNIYSQRFTQRLDALRTYVARTGSPDVPLAHIEPTPDGPVDLGKWVAYVRARYRKQQLPPERVAPLEAIPGWTWTARPPGPKPLTNRNAEIRGLRNEKLSLDAIAEHFDISKQRVHQILKRGY
jgi:hypothetical protein